MKSKGGGNLNNFSVCVTFDIDIRPLHFFDTQEALFSDKVCGKDTDCETKIYGLCLYTIQATEFIERVTKERQTGGRTNKL